MKRVFVTQLETKLKHLETEGLRIPTAAVISMVILAVAIPRLMLIGGLPATDEGYYAYCAQIVHASLSVGSGLPDAGPLMLYPLLLSWVFAFDVNPLIALRLMDMLVAVAAGYAFWRVIENESGGRLGTILISLLFLFTMNQSTFIQYGFKNSTFAAYIALFTALWLGLTAPYGDFARRWIAIGILLSVAILLRETLIPLVVVGALAVLIQRGFRSFFQLIVGGGGASLIIVGLMIASRGSIASLLESYQDAAKMYAAMADKRTDLFLSSGGQFIREANVALVIAAIGFIAALVRSLGKSSVTSLPKLAFWLVVTLVPLIEPVTKIGFPYHFAVCLPGLAGLAALGWRNICDWGSKAPRLQLACGAVSVAMLLIFTPRATGLWVNLPQSRDVLASFYSGHWPEIFTERSNYLMAAEVIRHTAPSGGTVAVSGHMYALYPLSGLLPPKPQLANLTNTII
jgi:hypothetical protein